MRSRPVLLVLAAALAVGCASDAPEDDTGAPDTGDTGPVDTDTDTADDTDTGDTDTDLPPVDRDGDGAIEGDDCDDTDSAVYPDAPETWDDVDGDCDGVVDGDGAWAGDIPMLASAIYEARRYNFELMCPFVGTRTLGQLSFTITCTPDPADEDAQRLLGATLTITPDDAEVEGDRWEGTAVFTSSNGWDSDGEGTIAWSSFDAADVDVEMGGVSLAARGSGAIAR